MKNLATGICRAKAKATLGGGVGWEPARWTSGCVEDQLRVRVRRLSGEEFCLLRLQWRLPLLFPGMASYSPTYSLKKDAGTLGTHSVLVTEGNLSLGGFENRTFDEEANSPSPLPQ